ncbi:MAG: ABC transporter permease, partial [Chitinophagaceae bacterium]|nr:ABC transporter permease [Chitinophagaceae bacterium]
VVFQFAVSVALIIATIVVGKQIQYAKDRSSGYSRDQLVEVPMYTRELYGHYDVLREDLLKTGVVYNMAQSQGSITADYGGTTDISWPGKAPGSSQLLMANRITHDFGGTVGWKLVKGRDFSRSFSTDTSAIIFNEEAIRVMGLQAPIDQIVRYSGKDYRIIGVAANIIKEDPFKPVKPTLYTLDYRGVNSVMIRIRQGANMQDALARIEQVFNRHSPSSPFDYKFVDDAYAVKFATELRIGKLAGFFAVFAIFISLMGLFGLAAFMAERRTREIGIRKVLGANILQIWTLLSKEFILLATLAFVIAAPVAYYFMNQWLENYSYRIQISLWIFAVVAICIVAVTVFTVSIQAIRAALMNPVRSIRTD